MSLGILLNNLEQPVATHRVMNEELALLTVDPHRLDAVGVRRQPHIGVATRRSRKLRHRCGAHLASAFGYLHVVTDIWSPDAEKSSHAALFSGMPLKARS